MQSLNRAMTLPDDVSDSKRSPEGIDLLIEQERKLLDGFDARQSSADSKAAAALAAALALATITLTGADSLSEREATFVKVVFALIAVAVALSFAARVLGGLKLHIGDRVSSESKETKEAREALWSYTCSDPDEIRALAHTLWHCRAFDSRKAAVARERWAGGAGVMLALVLVCTTLLVGSRDWGKSDRSGDGVAPVHQNK